MSLEQRIQEININTPAAQEPVTAPVETSASAAPKKPLTDKQLLQEQEFAIPVTTEYMSEWFALAAENKKRADREMQMRKNIIKQKFPTVVEGANNKVPLDNGWILQATGKVTRKLDEGAFKAIKQELIDANIPVDMIVKYKPELSKTIWKALNEDQTHLFAQCIVEVTASPTIEIKMPKRK